MDRRACRFDLRWLRRPLSEFCREHRLPATGTRIEIEELGHNLAAAGEWIKGLSGPPRDQALGAYTYTLARKDPNTAAAWAVTISDSKIRDKSLNGIATLWLHKDPAAASAWIQNSNLPLADKKRLLQLAPSG